MDLLLGNFVRSHINDLNDVDLSNLDYFISIDDEIISEWYYKNIQNKSIIENKISLMLKNFKL
jgi:succinate dehydrogenase flavin-adding protein (antitoxin of CptAB toxin-antitoxin module)